jgi:hypothetical protein
MSALGSFKGFFQLDFQSSLTREWGVYILLPFGYIWQDVTYSCTVGFSN